MDVIVNKWIKSFNEDVLEWNEGGEIVNEEVFGEIYHNLIHSGISSTLLQLEHSHAKTVEEKVGKGQKKLKAFKDSLDKELLQVSRGPSGDNELLISNYKAQHEEEYKMEKLRFESDISHVRDTQYREFREWVICVHDELNAEESLPPGDTPINSGKPSSSLSTIGSMPGSSIPRTESGFSIEAISRAPNYQESFTITLGAQMKQMHNLRIVAANVLDLCRYPSAQNNSSDSPDESLPQRLQTSMSLYSNNLCGVVLLSKLNGEKEELHKDLIDLCNRSTEFHFPSIEQQLEANLNGEINKSALEWREKHRRKKLLQDPEADVDKTPSKSLKNGDFHITRHSNLCEVHILFHMICDDSVLNGDINSRHPVIMGLRNILKTASLNDITSVTLPLLLTLELHEVMTVQWCMKRAELVFKCVKGFMMEVSSWGGSEIKTIQFLVPSDLDVEVFNKLCRFLPFIFRTSNPIRASH